MVKKILKDGEDRMHKAAEVLRQELAKIRTGKATTALLDGIKLDYYGAPTALNHVANIGVLDTHTLSIQPYDKGTSDLIQKAIQAANIGLNPLRDGDLIRVPIPALNEERRRELVKLTKKFGEESKIAVRNVRRDVIEHLKKSEKAEHFSEDERKRGETELQKMTDKLIKDIDALLQQKEKEIMEV
jgi:ribosome recycling factor